MTTRISKNLVVDKPLGVGQTWTDVTSSRSASTQYTNNTGQPIVVCVNDGGGQMDVLVDGTKIADSFSSAGGVATSITVIVPDGSTYELQGSFSNGWFELR